MGTTNVVIISYMPMLTHRPETIDFENGEFPDLDDLPDGTASGCVWMINNGTPTPVLVMDNAHQIIDHLITWAEEKPVEWFDLAIKRKDGKYIIALLPKLHKSIERWRIAFQLQYGYPYPEKDPNIRILFKPIHFVSGSANCLDELTLQENMEVGFLDTKHLNYQNPDKMGEHIKFIGPFKQEHDPYFNTYLDQALGDATEPTEKSHRFAT